MTTPLSLAVGRFKQLPQRSGATWQGGLVRIPAWVENPEDPSKPFRPTGAVWVSLHSGRLHVDLAAKGTRATPVLALDVLLEFAKKETRLGDGRPGRIEVADAELRDALDAALAGTGTAVVAVDSLPAVAEALRSLEASQTGSDALPGLLDSPGGIERVRAFASAAERFYLARPWQHLVNEDLIVVEAPKAPKGMACLSVLGNGGQEFGIGFFESRKAFERVLNMTSPRSMTRAFGVTFGTPDELPFADVDAWEDHGLPVAGPQAYPLVADIQRDGRVRRPNAKALTYIEAMLRALADSTEADYDSGCWQREVTTFDGPLLVTLTLPGLLESETEGVNDAEARGLLDAPPEVAANRPLTALEKAQELVYDAEEAVGRRRIVLAKRALALSPDCADACRLLGEAASTAEEAQRWFLEGVEAGRRAIGDSAFEALSGRFWGHLETRPYMRARLALAHTLLELGCTGEALDHLRDLLGLNPDDNQGVRYVLLPLLLEAGLDDEAGRLLQENEDDASATWWYGRALWLFRTQGDSAASRTALLDARRANPYVPRYLLDPDELPWVGAPYMALGSADEAADTAEALLEAYEMTDGALVWLAELSAGRRSASGRRPRRTSGRRRRLH